MVDARFSKDRFDVSDLVALMALLRSENGCPWDREQTHASIRKNLIEETYEVIDALDREDVSDMREELGDLLLQIVFHTQMETEAGHFDLEDVTTELCQKLIVRHPHIFSDVQADNSDQVLANWDRIKKETKQQKTFTDTLTAVPASLPALMRAEKVQKRAARAGMDFASASDVAEKLLEEAAELKEAISSGESEAVAEELGDLFFAACNLARFTGNDSEEVLTRATEKFIRRFQRVEELADKQPDKLSPEQLDLLWEQAKSEGV